jgi:PKD repeat protein
MKLKLLTPIVCFLFIVFSSNLFAACKADFNIHRVSANSFYLTDTSTCNKSQTSFSLKVTNGTQTSVIGYGYNVTIPFNGTARILLMIYDSSAACFDSISKTFVVSGNNNCKADFHIANINGLYTSFGLLYYNPASVRYKMDFGDGSFAYSMNTNHTYASCGTYTATLYARDSTQSALDTFVYTFKIGINPIITAYKINNSSYSFGNNSFYTIEGFQLHSDSINKKCHWDFGDGDTSSNNYINHTYTNPGTYTVKLVITFTGSANACSKKDSTTFTLQVGCSITPNFTYTLTGNTYSFDNTTSGSNLRYLWRFGDTTTSTQKHPTHVFKTHKNYLTELVAIDTVYGCRDSIAKYTKFCNIVANLQLVYDSAHPYQATLYNYSSGPINKHHWDFGDGTKSNASAPVHNYSTTGFISLRYIGTDSTTGCSDTAVINFTIDGSGNIKRKAFVFTVVDKTNTASVDEVAAKASFNVFPNPFTNQLNLTLSGSDIVQSIAVFNGIGQEVNTNIELKNDREYLINATEEMATGIYFVKITMEHSIAYLKVVKGN